MSQVKRILVPHDYGDTSSAAADYAASLARVFGADVWFLHVEELAPFNDYLGSALELDGAASKEVRDKVHGDSAVAPAGTPARYFVRSGPPAAEIARFAGENAVDLIVMGTHGRGGVAHMVLGSVAERVVRTAPCPVLTVRRPVPAVNASESIPAGVIEKVPEASL
jgi:nucleotide-binding universal stress UspA family protein